MTETLYRKSNWNSSVEHCFYSTYRLPVLCTHPFLKRVIMTGTEFAWQSSLRYIGWFSLGSDWVNPEDPNVIAENELLGAAASIEAAARKLAELKPKPRPKVRIASTRVVSCRILCRVVVWYSNGIDQCFLSLSLPFSFFIPQEADETLNFEEQILEAAKAITAATVALVKSASAAQRELVETGRVSWRWSCG